jgi:lipoyl(octanoyl) transferase
MRKTEPLIIRRLGRIDYGVGFAAMQAFTNARNSDQPDELWLLDHPPVFTLGINSQPKHILNPGDIPIIQSDRGGQVTYHGPGQIVVYVLVDLKRAGLGIRRLVTVLEESVISLLSNYDIAGEARPDAPGVYVDGRKIASLGLRVRRGCSYHGLSFNLDMDLSPFLGINPCGYPGLEMVQMRELAGDIDRKACADQLVEIVTANLGYNSTLETEVLPEHPVPTVTVSNP